MLTSLLPNVNCRHMTLERCFNLRKVDSVEHTVPPNPVVPKPVAVVLPNPPNPLLAVAVVVPNPANPLPFVVVPKPPNPLLALVVVKPKPPNPLLVVLPKPPEVNTEPVPPELKILEDVVFVVSPNPTRKI